MRALAAVAALAFLIGCGSSTAPPATPSATAASAAPSPSAEHVDGAAAHKLVQDGATLVDVRSADEYAQKHIDGAVNVPAAQIASHDFGGKDKPLVLYCNAGHRSQEAAQTLRASGYSKVYVLGAMSTWGN